MKRHILDSTTMDIQSYLWVIENSRQKNEYIKAIEDETPENLQRICVNKETIITFTEKVKELRKLRRAKIILR